MNREQICHLFSEALKKELIGTKYNDRPIQDVRVEIDTESLTSDDSLWSDDYDTIKIKVLTSTPKGRLRNWEYYYI